MSLPAYAQWNYVGNGVEQLSYGSSPKLQLIAPNGYGVGSIDVFTYASSVPSAQWQVIDNGAFSADQVFFTSVGGSYNAAVTERMRILGGKGSATTTGGYVGIGTSNPVHLLHVAGTIGAEEVIVSSTGADYVFQDGYKLKPLSEVKRFISENRHLPGIPSASEVTEKGLGLGEMQSKLLAKVEELTLHMIRAEEENHELRERLARIEARNNKDGK